MNERESQREIESYFEDNFPGNSVFARFRRRFRKFISVDPSSQHTKNHFKSVTVVKTETLRHILFHRNYVHCFSRFRRYWELVMIFTYASAFVFIPYDVAFYYGQERHKWSLFISQIVSTINIIQLIDLTINFRTGYQDPKTKRVVLDGWKIAVHYIRFDFWVDLLSSFPDRIIAHGLSDERRDAHEFNLNKCLNDDDGFKGMFHCCWHVLVVLSLLIFLQMPLFFGYLDHFFRGLNRSNFFIKTVRNLLTLVFGFHFLVCLNFLIVRVTDEPLQLARRDNFRRWERAAIFWNSTTTNNYEKYIESLYYTTYTITLFATSIEEETQIDMTVGIVYTIIGFVLHIWLVSEAYTYLRTTYGPSVRFQEIRYQMQKYMAFKRLSTSIQQRILAFYDFSFDGNFFRKREINEILGPLLQQSVTMETCKQMLVNNYFYGKLPEELLMSMANCMSEVVFLCNDVICRIDTEQAQKLYLIVSGTVAVYTEDGDEVAHLHDGNLFGEVAFLLVEENHSSLNYVATEECVLLVLQRSDFMKIVAEKPEVLTEMRENLRKRYSMATRMNEEELIEALKEKGKLFA